MFFTLAKFVEPTYVIVFEITDVLLWSIIFNHTRSCTCAGHEVKVNLKIYIADRKATPV